MTSSRSHALRCRCGTFRGHVLQSRSAIHAICYCKDCQAYARFLGVPGITDPDGGTQVAAMLPEHVHFTAGVDRLACLSLREHGLLRWYASCCNTPIGNTPRNRKVPYAGMVHACLGEPAAIEATFGPLRIAVNTKSARRAVPSTGFATFKGVIKLMTSAVRARVGGSYQDNPFFVRESGEPIRSIRVLTDGERELAYRTGA